MFFYKNNQNVYWSENADVVFAYACALDALPRNPLQGRALINLKWATDLGHAKAKEYHKIKCKSLGICTHCHSSKFKGLFTKTCANCGKKREY